MNESQKSLWQLLISILALALNSASAYLEKKEIVVDPAVKRKR